MAYMTREIPEHSALKFALTYQFVAWEYGEIENVVNEFVPDLGKIGDIEYFLEV